MYMNLFLQKFNHVYWLTYFNEYGIIENLTPNLKMIFSFVKQSFIASDFQLIIPML